MPNMCTQMRYTFTERFLIGPQRSLKVYYVGKKMCLSGYYEVV